MNIKRTDLRNIAIIAHVDHGKTTLVDEMLKQSGTFRENQTVEERIMDSNDLERERGITILAKNTSIHYKDIKVNIIDTPGHADFSGEVERVLKMVSGVLLLVDAAEGPMPQTRFVLQKALDLGLKIIIVVNKIDRTDARLTLVVDEIHELFLDLDPSNDLRSPIIYCSGRQGTATLNLNKPAKDLEPLFETIINSVAPPEGDPDGELQLLVSSIDYNNYSGRIGIGRIERGIVKANSEVAVCNYHDGPKHYKSKIVNLYQIEGLKQLPTQSASVGDIVCFSGVENVNIGDTISSPILVEPVPFVKISEPTVEMFFYVNDSPLAGKEGKFVTTRHLKDRLEREMLRDVSLKVYSTDSADAYRVCGRGEMHLSILIETMRRAGYEFQVGTPQVIYREIDGERHEPIDLLIVDVPKEREGSVYQKMGIRKGMPHGSSIDVGSRVRLEFLIPSRGLFGYRSEFLTDTKGEGVMNTVFYGYEPYKGEVVRRSTGSLIAFETGEAVTYGLHNAQERGQLFIAPGTKVYEGMVVGVSPKDDDIAVNVCKRKHVTNMRASGSDEALRLNSVKKMSLEEAIEFIKDDELLEVTPQNIRIRKRILNNDQRMKLVMRNK